MTEQQTNTNLTSVHALNINLFAYYLKSALTDDMQQFDHNINTLHKIYQSILDKFQPEFNNHNNNDQDQSIFDYELKENDSNNSSKQKLLKENYKIWSSSQKNNHPTAPQPLYKLFFYPQKLNNDTYALLLNIYRPQKDGYDLVTSDEFSKFHPTYLIAPDDHPGFIGKTILVTAFLPDNFLTNLTNNSTNDSTNTSHHHQNNLLEKLKEIANHLSQKLFAESCPPFYQAGEILDSYIFEYSQPKQKGDRLLIIFYLTEDTPKRIQPIYLQLPELFLAYHKIIYTFQCSRTWNVDAKKLARDIEISLQSLTNLSKDPTDVIDIKELQKTLQKLLKIAPAYSLKIRNLEYAVNNINIHKQNYQIILNSFQDKIGDQLEFLHNFLTEQTFIQQIEADLNYLRPASNLLDQAINTIRGLIDIQQAEIDIAKTESDRSLERTIQIFGVGLGFGGIVSSTISGYIQEPVSLIPNFSKPIHPGLLSLVISVLLGILAALGMAGFIYRRSLLDKIKKYFTSN
jgi:hypothetical protein